MMFPRFVWSALGFFLIFSFTFSGFAEEAASVIQQIETRRGTWTHLKASVAFQFLSGDTPQASCEGTLAYQRLDEKLLVQCFQAVEGKKEKRMVFALKTDDRDFELYLPGHKTVYRGNIFMLEESPAIESRLRPWDLYRALKSLSLPSSASAETLPGGIYVTVPAPQGEGVARKLKLSAAFDVEEETYFNAGEKASVEIRRSDFQPVSKSSPAAFPAKILIVQPRPDGVPRQAALSFTNLDFENVFAENETELNLPEDTRILELEEPVEN